MRARKLPDSGVAFASATAGGTATAGASPANAIAVRATFELAAMLSPSVETSDADSVSRRRSMTMLPTGSAAEAASSVYCVPAPAAT